MKKVLWSITLLLGLFGMYSCQETELLNQPVTQLQLLETPFQGKNVVPGQLVIKLLKEPAEVKIAQTRSGEPMIETGLMTIDEICANIGASNMKRVFRHSGKYEPRARKAGLHLWYVVEFPEIIPLTRAATDFHNDELVDIVEPVQVIVSPITDPTTVIDHDVISDGFTRNSSQFDPYSNLQWHYHHTGTTFTYGAHINLHEAWEVTVGHPNVIVAVLDAGIQHNHEDLEENMWVNEGEIPGNGIDDDNNGYVDDYYGYNFYDNSPNIASSNHGTHIAGIIGAVTRNGKGVSGIAGGKKVSGKRGVRLMNCQIAHPQTGYVTLNTLNVVDAIHYGADNGAVISQNSWGGYLNSQYLEQAIDYFTANAGTNELGVQTGPMKGGIVIAAAGNDDVELKSYPAAYSNVISVTSIGPDFKKPRYSNYGSWTDIAAPGGNRFIANGEVFSTVSGNRYGFMEGTSMACPHVSGIAALVLSKAVEHNSSNLMTSELLKEILLTACNPSQLNNYNPGLYLGKGLINAATAVNVDTGFPTIEPILIGPDCLEEGQWGNFRVNWQGYRPMDDYIFEWLDYNSYIEVEPSETGMSAAIRGFDEGSPAVAQVTIKGKYNGYIKTLVKDFEVTEIDGNFARFKLQVYNGSPNELNFTLHGTDIKNRKIPSPEIGNFGTHLTPGRYRFVIDCLSIPNSPYVYDKLSFETEITTLGADLTIEVENIGIRVINFHNYSPSHPNIYRWFFEEGAY